MLFPFPMCVSVVSLYTTICSSFVLQLHVTQFPAGRGVVVRDVAGKFGQILNRRCDRIDLFAQVNIPRPGFEVEAAQQGRNIFPSTSPKKNSWRRASERQ